MWDFHVASPSIFVKCLLYAYSSSHWFDFRDFPRLFLLRPEDLSRILWHCYRQHYPYRWLGQTGTTGAALFTNRRLLIMLLAQQLVVAFTFRVRFCWVLHATTPFHSWHPNRWSSKILLSGAQLALEAFALLELLSASYSLHLWQLTADFSRRSKFLFFFLHLCLFVVDVNRLSFSLMLLLFRCCCCYSVMHVQSGFPLAAFY